MAVLYEYRCEACGGKTGIVFASMKRAPRLGSKSAKPCPLCQQTALRRILSLPASNRAAQKFAGQYPYASRRWRHLKGCTGSDEAGFPVIESKAHEQKVADLNGLVRE